VIPEDHRSLTQHYRSWRVECPPEYETQTCWAFVVSRHEDTDCSRADIDESGGVGQSDYAILVDHWGEVCE
jgi:hypothetical protein